MEQQPGTMMSAERGSTGACIVLGALLAFISVYMLVIQPSIDGAEVLGYSIVNLQRLAIGQTSGVAAAIFLAAGMRPRQ
jgi:hypothetical protein